MNLLLGDGDDDPNVVLLVRMLIMLVAEGVTMIGSIGGSFRKLFCLVRLVGEFDRILFCGMELNEPF